MQGHACNVQACRSCARKSSWFAGLRQNISRDAQCELEEGLVEHLCEVRALTVGEAWVECVAMVGAALDELIGTLLRSDAWCVGASDIIDDADGRCRHGY